MRETGKKDEIRIDVFRAWCKACGICVAFCPTGVLEKDEEGYPYAKDIQRCINCGWCEIRCPDFAITVERGSKQVEKIELKSEVFSGEEEISPERLVTSGE